MAHTALTGNSRDETDSRRQIVAHRDAREQVEPLVYNVNDVGDRAEVERGSVHPLELPDRPRKVIRRHEGRHHGVLVSDVAKREPRTIRWDDGTVNVPVA